MKRTAVAPSNIALIKYWGKKDASLRIPENDSVSFTLSGLTTRTTVEFDPALVRDEVTVDGVSDTREARRVSAFLDLIRVRAGMEMRARIVSRNSFPSGRGLSSSASGFAALAVAGASAAGLSLDTDGLSRLARMGSGSACRSVPDGWVRWHAGTDDASSYAECIFAPGHWDIVDVVVVTGEGKKDVPTSEGMATYGTSPFMGERLRRIRVKIDDLVRAVGARDLEAVGSIVEAEALEMHAVMLTSNPALLYWTHGTLHFMKKIREWRRGGLPVWFTINTGQDIHCLTDGAHAKHLERRIREEKEHVRDVLVCTPCQGTVLSKSHLF